MIWRHAADPRPAPDERGQASLMMLAVVAAVLVGAAVLFVVEQRAHA
jgi:hypothetical protein